MSDYLLLIDGSSLLTTQFFGNLPREIMFAKTLEEKEQFFHKIMQTSDGYYTNAVYGFVRTLVKILKEQKPSHIAVAWDVSRNTFRRELYADYKGTRTETLYPLKEQFMLCQFLLDQFHIVQFMDERYEADDFCGTLAAKFEGDLPVRIMTKDNDYLQLVTERSELWLMHSSAEKTDELYKKYGIDKAKVNAPDRCFVYTPELIKQEFGVCPENVNSLKGIQGDPSDNIKGVPGVGEATAKLLIGHYHTVDALYEDIHSRDKKGLEELKKFWKEELGIKRSPLNFLMKESEEELVGEKSARLSELLATIKKDIPMEGLSLSDLVVQVDVEQAKRICGALEFKTIDFSFEENYGAAGAGDSERQPTGATGNSGELSVEAAGASGDIVGRDEQQAVTQTSSTPYSFVAALEDKGLFENAGEMFSHMSEKAASVKLVEEEQEPVPEFAFQEIGDLAGAEELFEKLRRKKPVFLGFSFEEKETEGQQSLFDENEIGLWLSESQENNWYVPAKGFVTEEWLNKRLKELIEACPDTVFATFEWKEQLHRVGGRKFSNMADMKIAAYLLNPVETDFAPERVAERLQEEWLQEETKKAERGSQIALAGRPKSLIARVAAEVYLPRLAEQGMKELFCQIEMPLVVTLYDMEQRGIRVERDLLKQYSEELSVRIAALEQEIYKLAGEEFNINSPKQLGVILFEKLHLPYGKKTKTGYSTSADVLERLRTEDPIIGLILDYRQVAKLKSTYADGLDVFIREDSRIHGRFHQTIAATGRISSTDPNLQNIPIRMELGRQIRKAFVPEDGYVFLDADYSQIELRVLAHMSGDEKLIEAYRSGQDIHRLTASQVFHTPFAEVTSAQRSNAKAVNFGIVYGISAFGLSQDLNITRKEAEEYISNYFATYPDVKRYMDELVEQGKKEGYVSTIYGRRRPIPEFASANFMQRQFGERVAMNSPIQGTAADIIKIAMIRVNERLKKEAPESRLLLQIHDELLVETRKDQIAQVQNIMEEEMRHAAELLVPLEVEVKQGDSWFEAK